MKTALLALMLATVPALAQPITASKALPPADQGTALFRGLFHFYGVQPVTETGRGQRDTIVVVFGPLHDAESPAYNLIRTTLAAGGSVFVATDSGYDTRPLFAGVEAIQMLPGPVRSNQPNDCLANISDYPLVSGVWPFVGAAQGEILRLATITPGSLQIVAPPKYVNGFTVAFPKSCSRGNLRLEADELFAAGGTGPENKPYRFAVMADHKVFSNQMMYASAQNYRGVTPDNFRIANELVKWLTAEGTRKKCVFIENGRIQPKFDDFDFTAMPMTPPKDVPFPPLPNLRDGETQKQIANFIDERIANLEDDPQIQQAFSRNNRFYGALLGFLALFGLSVALVLFARRVWRARHSPDYQPLPADPHMLGGDAPLGSFEHRRLELLRGGDFRGPVAAYIRRLFESRGLSIHHQGGPMPPLDIQSRNRGELKAMIRELWDEAFVFDRDPLPYTRWKQIEPSLAAVKSAADGGLWRFRGDRTPSG